MSINCGVQSDTYLNYLLQASLLDGANLFIRLTYCSKHDTRLLMVYSTRYPSKLYNNLHHLRAVSAVASPAVHIDSV
jgi:hypothetical protein